MNTFTAVMLVVTVITQATRLGAAEIDPNAPPDPLNRVFFGARTYPEKGHMPHVWSAEVGSVAECIENAVQLLAKEVSNNNRAIEVRCIKERNVENPS